MLTRLASGSFISASPSVSMRFCQRQRSSNRDQIFMLTLGFAP